MTTANTNKIVMGNEWDYAPIAPAAMIESEFDRIATQSGCVIVAIYAAKHMSVPLKIVRDWTRKHLKK